MHVSAINSPTKRSPRSRVLKRIFDLICVVPGLIFLSPAFLTISIMIKLTDRGTVLFKQERIGYKGEPFRILKFRTMVVGAEKLGGQLTVGRDRRITKIGHLLRKTKLDELPQLINVLKGEMTLVGPRPEVPGYVHLYSGEQRRVLDLLPGITDPASIHYRDENEVLANAENPEKVYIEEIMPKKIHINLDYARDASILSDISVIIRTLFAIVK